MSAKNNILALLEKNKGKTISGNDIAQELNITRAAVWKAVDSLREEGYQVSGVNKKGYCLDVKNDILSVQSIRPYIKNPDFYSNIKIYKALTSTNDEAKTLANSSAPSGTVVITNEQTKGKGRLGRSFYSPESSAVYMSVIFRLQNPIEQTMLITAGAAVAVCRAIKKVCGLECLIKWVNDVYLNEKKVCGILTEASMSVESKTLEYIVVGIGVNTAKIDFPDELKEIATSLENNMHGKTVLRSTLIAAILNELLNVINDLSDKTFLEEYKELSFVIGEKINVISPLKTFVATAVDINDQGHLIVQIENGETMVLNSGEISIRKI